MTAPSIPRRHWRPDGTDPLPTAHEALDVPLRAFPAWFLCIECRCGTVQLINELHTRRLDLPLRTLLVCIRHEGCGGRLVKAELLTDVEGVSSRRIVLMAVTATDRSPAGMP